MTYKQLQATAAGKINNIPKYSKEAIKTKGKYNQIIETTLTKFAAKIGGQLIKEFRFDPVRRWRADFCIPEIRLMVEYEGLMSDKSRHTRAVGYSGDCSKYNSAALQGWTVLRYTVLNYTDLEKDLDKLQHYCKNKLG